MSAFSKAGVFMIRFYQAALSPILGPAKCRFYPSCSEYAAEAVSQYGLPCGSFLAVRRLLHCGPWSEGGYDPVPSPDEIERFRFGKFFVSLRKDR